MITFSKAFFFPGAAILSLTQAHMTVEADEPLVETEQLLGTIESGTTVEEMAVAYQKLLVIFRQDPDFNWSNSISLASRLTACFKRELDRLINDMGDEDINSSEDL